MPNTKPLSAVTSADIQGMRTILKVNGAGPTVVRNLAKQYHLTESDMQAMAQAITTAPPKPKATALTESAPQARHERILFEAAQHLLDSADRAEADLSTASISDLEAYATLGIGARAFSR